MHKKRKRYLVITVLIVILVFVCCAINKFRTSLNKDKNDLDISFYRIEQAIKSNITERAILQIDGSVLLGYSKKELENGYYDLKICNEKKSLDIYVNKAWKEFNDKLYQEEYINQVVYSIMDILEMDSENTQKDLYEYILEGYKVSKGLIDNKLNIDESLKIESIELKRNIVNSELILSISKEVDK